MGTSRTVDEFDSPRSPPNASFKAIPFVRVLVGSVLVGGVAMALFFAIAKGIPLIFKATERRPDTFKRYVSDNSSEWTGRVHSVQAIPPSPSPPIARRTTAYEQFCSGDEAHCSVMTTIKPSEALAGVSAAIITDNKKRYRVKVSVELCSSTTCKP